MLNLFKRKPEQAPQRPATSNQYRRWTTSGIITEVFDPMQSKTIQAPNPLKLYYRAELIRNGMLVISQQTGRNDFESISEHVHNMTSYAPGHAFVVYESKTGKPVLPKSQAQPLEIKTFFESLTINCVNAGDKDAPWDAENRSHYKLEVYNRSNKKRGTLDYWTTKSCAIYNAQDVLDALLDIVYDAIDGTLAADRFASKYKYSNAKEALRDWKQAVGSYKQMARLYDGNLCGLAERLKKREWNT